MVVRAPRLVRNPSRILFRTHLIPRASPFKPLAVQASPFSSGTLSMENMKALVYTGPGKLEFQERAIPTIQSPTDAIVKMRHTTICGTDLHILKGDVPSIEYGRVLGHEGVGSIVAVGSAVTEFKADDTVLISAITGCGVCSYCRRGMSSHCSSGGWLLGNSQDGTQAEYVRIPHATSSLYKIPASIDPRAAVTLSDAFPTGMESGAMNACVQPGSTVAVIGAGPVGLAAMLTAKLYSPSYLVAIDLDETRLGHAKRLGADETVNPSSPSAMEALEKATDGVGFDAVIEAVGVPKTFELSQKLVAPGGSLANVGVHGQKVDLHLDKLWDRNIAIRTKLLDAYTIPTLIRLSSRGIIDPAALLTHHFPFSQSLEAYEAFKAASVQGTLKVAIDF